MSLLPRCGECGGLEGSKSHLGCSCPPVPVLPEPESHVAKMIELEAEARRRFLGGWGR